MKKKIVDGYDPFFTFLTFGYFFCFLNVVSSDSHNLNNRFSACSGILLPASSLKGCFIFRCVVAIRQAGAEMELPTFLFAMDSSAKGWPWFLERNG